MRSLLAVIVGCTCGWLAKPEPQLLLPCTVVEVVDGDTLTAQLVMQTRVRLDGIDAPELSQPGGPEAKQHLIETSMGRDGLLRVPLRGRVLGDHFSFGRVIGDVLVDGKSVSDQQVISGHAVRVEP